MQECGESQGITAASGTNIQVLDAQRAAGDHHCAEDDDEQR
jgi:hypothetical protein